MQNFKNINLNNFNIFFYICVTRSVYIINFRSGFYSFNRKRNLKNFLLKKKQKKKKQIKISFI